MTVAQSDAGNNDSVGISTPKIQFFLIQILSQLIEPYSYGSFFVRRTVKGNWKSNQIVGVEAFELV